MSERIITDRTTRFTLMPGAAFRIEIMDPELQVWERKEEGQSRSSQRITTIIEVRLLEVVNG